MRRGQVHTLEAVIGALLLLTSVVFALQMTAVTPLSASTSSQHIENQQQASAEGILAGAAEQGELKRAVLFWNSTRGQFHNTSGEIYYDSSSPPNGFGDRLERAFDTNGIAYNVYVNYYTVGGGRRIDRMVYQGEPSDNAVRAARTVVITDGDRLVAANGTVSNDRVERGNFYAGDMSPGSPTYNVVRVEVVAWRI